jgi:hypothetical protein
MATIRNQTVTEEPRFSIDPTNAANGADSLEGIRALAHALDCILEVELRALAKITSSTAEAWRKRGRGPPYIVFGNAILYPMDGVAEFLKTQVRERREVPARALL